MLQITLIKLSRQTIVPAKITLGPNFNQTNFKISTITLIILITAVQKWEMLANTLQFMAIIINLLVFPMAECQTLNIKI